MDASSKHAIERKRRKHGVFFFRIENIAINEERSVIQMLNQIGPILLVYAKAGILAHVILTVALTIRLLYVVLRYNLVENNPDIMDEIKLKNEQKNGVWWYIALKYILWPWGILQIAHDYSELEREILKIIKEKHTC